MLRVREGFVIGPEEALPLLAGAHLDGAGVRRWE
jgi:hypothetical protein